MAPRVLTDFTILPLVRKLRHALRLVKLFSGKWGPPFSSRIQHVITQKGVSTK